MENSTVKFIVLLLFVFLISLSDGQQLIPQSAKNYSDKYHSYCLLGTDSNATFFCEGILVKLNWILTSASCSERLFGKEKKKSKGNVFAWIGLFENLHNDVQERLAVKYVTYRKIMEKDVVTGQLERSDLVLIQLNESFKKAENVEIAKLPEKENSRCTSTEIKSIFLTPSYNQTEINLGGRSVLLILGVAVLKGIVAGTTGYLVYKYGHYIPKGINWFFWNVIAKAEDPEAGRRKKRNGPFKCKYESSKIVCPPKKKFCAAIGGGPLFCKDKGTLIAIEKKCISAFEAGSSVDYIKVQNYVEFIAETVGDKKQRATPTEKSAARTSHKKERTKMMLTAICLIYFIKFSF